LLQKISIFLQKILYFWLVLPIKVRGREVFAIRHTLF